MKFIINEKTENVSKKMIGGKAYSLYLLGRQSNILNIPSWFSIKEDTLSSIKSNPENLNIFKEELQTELNKYNPEQLWAVRSSASTEDGIKNSFAGQLDTYLYVRKDQVEKTIHKVWESINSEHFNEYIKDKNIDVSTSPSVLIQKMVNPDCSGVGFGINPVTLEKEYIISSVFGLGNLLVSGESDADTWIMKGKEITSEVLAHKEVKEVLSTNGFGTDIVNNDHPNKASLSNEQILKIGEVIKEVNDFYKHPQDIEWAIENNKVYLLQSRPITSVNSGKELLWDNSNIAESYGGVTTPLTFSFAKKAYENVYRQLCIILNLSSSRVEEHDVIFKNMLGLIQGRVYYNMNSWYKTLALMPGFSLNKKFMEQMMGVQESLSNELVKEIQQSISKNKVVDALHMFKTIIGLSKSLLLLDKTVNNFYDRLNDALENKELEGLSTNDLLKYYTSLEMKLLKKWDAPMINDLFAMVFYGLLRKLSKDWCNDENESIQNTLILTQGNIISAEPAKIMKSIALKINDLNIEENDMNKWIKIIESSQIKVEIDQYIDKFGDRCLDELKLESITLTDNPYILYQTLFEMSKNKNLLLKSDTEANESELSKKLENDLLKSLPYFKRKVFGFVLKMARKTVKQRENLRFERTRLFGRVRRIFVEMGKRFEEDGIIESSRDIFYLELEEIQDFIQGTSTLNNLKGLIALRKEEFHKFEIGNAPSDRFVTHGIVYFNNKYQGKAITHVLEGDYQKGLGCCPGIVRGKVKVVRDPKNVKVEKGDILVAERTDPGWIMLFSSVSGILVEKGSLLSHAAIVSRELNLPAVVSVPGLLSWLKDDDIVEMDGTTGTIRKINEEGQYED